ncbi:MAG: choice-of-anchor D domain-containing protein [Chloroflexota bacterium]|nr:choice-of-anchor D domain-containing protein [Chloroflexota bacterium]
MAGPAVGVVDPGALPQPPHPGALPQPPGTTTLVSERFGGGFAGGGSITPSISSNGRYVAFVSGAADLVAGDTNGAVDLFVRDRSKGTTIRLPLPGSGGEVTEPSISANGKVVAYTYQPASTVAVARSFVYAWDRDTGQTEVVSRNGRISAPDSREPSVSTDGRYIAYTSSAGNLVSGDSNESDDVFRYDRRTGTSILISVGFEGGTPSGASTQPSISGDGSMIAFSSDAGDSLLNEDTGNGNQVYLRDVGAKRTERISVTLAGGPPDGLAERPSISADGRWVAFESRSTNLVAATADLKSANLVYRRDRGAGVTELVSVDADGLPAPGATHASISRDGRMVAFASGAAGMVAGIPLGAAPPARVASDIYIRDMTAAETVLISVDLTGLLPGALSLEPVVAGNGRFVAFYSTSPNLVRGDNNKAVDVFIRDLPPVPFLNPAVIEFGTRAVGTDPVAAAAVLVNAGWGPLTVSAVSTDGSARGDYTIQGDGCTKRVLYRQEACTVTIGFAPTKPGARTATLKIDDGYTGSPRTARLSGKGSLAKMVLEPKVGQPGIVVTATGSGFPPGGQLRLRWSLGLTPSLPVITADAKGGFRIQVLVFHNDRTGRRDLVAESVGGSPFPPVQSRMLVSESSMGPPGFVLQRLIDVPLVLMIR